MESVQHSNTSVQNTELSRGQRVRVKLHGGDTADRIVWEAKNGHVYVCSERSYAWLEQGKDAPLPIGFPLADVVFEGN